MLKSTPEYLAAHTQGLHGKTRTLSVRAAMAAHRERRRDRLVRSLSVVTGRWRTATSRVRYSKTTWAIILTGLVMLLAACGSGDDTAADTSVPATPTAPAQTMAATTTTTEAGPETTLPTQVEITAADYEFRGIPDVVPAGTRLKLLNASSDEFHMALIIRLDPKDDRTSDELIALDVLDVIDQGAEEFPLGTPQAVMLARPGEPGYATPVGSPVVFNPGRYAVFCLIPVGADPAEAEARADAGPPVPADFEGTIPHYQGGMYAEFTVEA